eukprot:762950-Prorocentrum_minimum.AAC.2
MLSAPLAPVSESSLSRSPLPIITHADVIRFSCARVGKLPLPIASPYYHPCGCYPLLLRPYRKAPSLARLSLPSPMWMLSAPLASVSESSLSRSPLPTVTHVDVIRFSCARIGKLPLPLASPYRHPCGCYPLLSHPYRKAPSPARLFLPLIRLQSPSNTFTGGEDCRFENKSTSARPWDELPLPTPLVPTLVVDDR